MPKKLIHFIGELFIKDLFSKLKRFPFIERMRRNLKMGFVKYYIRMFRIHFVRPFVMKMNYEKLDFRACAIENQSYCNRQCDFCFNNPKFPKREQGIMGRKIWKKIIDELAELNYCGRIGIHSWNEPLLDKRLPKLVAYARKKCPNAFIQIPTNGDFLNENLLRVLINSGVDEMYITNYDDKIKPDLDMFSKKYLPFVKYRSYKDFKPYNRPLVKLKDNPLICDPCFQLSSKVLIDWKGRVLLCCQDFYAEHCFGNVSENTIKEIRSSKKFKDYCKKLETKRKSIKICKYCTHHAKIAA